MAQTGWIFTDNLGHQHQIGLFHGDETGHLVIYCDWKIMQVDFAVRHPTSYSFFIEDELCEVQIDQLPNGKFHYQLQVNNEADTPLNKIRKKERLIEKKGVITVAAVMLVFLIALLGFNRWQTHRKNERYGTPTSEWLHNHLTADQIANLRQNSKIATATFFIVPDSNDAKSVFTFMTANYERVSGQMPDHFRISLQLPNGFLLSDGDQFTALYDSAHPEIYVVCFDRPTPGTLLHYQKQAADRFMHIYPSYSSDQTNCMAQSVYLIKGLNGLAAVVSSSKQGNDAAFKKLMQNADLMEVFAKKCNK